MSAPTSPPSSRRSKNRSIECKVLLLDNTTLSVNIPVKSTGQVLFDEVIKKLQLLEADYFDLEYTDLRNTRCWLDHDKPILRQLPRHNLDFQFLVKFYTPDPGFLEEHFTRYLFALQLKRDLITGELPCQEHTAVLLASYIVQADLGDFTDELVVPDYLRDVQLLPEQTVELEQKIAEHHRDHAGQSPAVADFNLLDTARKVDLYGIQMHAAKDHENVPLHLAVAHLGVLVFQNQTKINTFSWAKIRKLSFKRKKFLVKLHPEGYGYYKDIVEFFFESRSDCKNFWKKCVEHHAFFRCQSVKRLPRNKTRLVSRGSSFRYCGRTQKQLADYVREHSNKRPEFQRSTSMRTISLSHSAAATPKVGTLKKSKDHHLSHPNIRSSNSSHAICLKRALARETQKQSGHYDAPTPVASQSLQTFELKENSPDSVKQASPVADKTDIEDLNAIRKSRADVKNGTMDDFNCSYFKDTYNSGKRRTGNAVDHDNVSQDSYQLAGSRNSLDNDRIDPSGDEIAGNEVKLEEMELPEPKEATEMVSPNGIKSSDGESGDVLTEVNRGPAAVLESIEAGAVTAGIDQLDADAGMKSDDTINHPDDHAIKHLPDSVAAPVSGAKSEKRKRLSRGEHICDSPLPHDDAFSNQNSTDIPQSNLNHELNDASSVSPFESSGNQHLDVLQRKISSDNNCSGDLLDKVSCTPGHFENSPIGHNVVESETQGQVNELSNKTSEIVKRNAEIDEKDQKPDVKQQKSSVPDKTGENLGETKVNSDTSTPPTASCSSRKVLTQDAEYPYLLHKRHFSSKGEQTDGKVLNCPALNLRSRSLSPSKRPSKAQQRAELEKVKVMLSKMTSQVERSSGGSTRILDFLKYSRLPPKDSFSSKDDSVSPTVTEIALTAKRRSQSENPSNTRLRMKDSDLPKNFALVSATETPRKSADVKSEPVNRGKDPVIVAERFPEADQSSNDLSRLSKPVETSAEDNSSKQSINTDQIFELSDLPPPPSLEGSTSSLEQFLANINLPPPVFESDKTDPRTSSEKSSFQEILDLPPPLDIDELLNDKCLQVELYIHESPTAEVLSKGTEPEEHDLDRTCSLMMAPTELLLDNVTFRPIRLPEDQFESVLLSPPLLWRDDTEPTSYPSEHHLDVEFGDENHSFITDSSDPRQNDIPHELNPISVTDSDSVSTPKPNKKLDSNFVVRVSPSVRTYDFPVAASSNCISNVSETVDLRLLNPGALCGGSSTHGDISDEDDVEMPYSEKCLHDVYQELEMEALTLPFRFSISAGMPDLDDCASCRSVDSLCSETIDEPICFSEFSETLPKLEPGISDSDKNSDKESALGVPILITAAGANDIVVPPPQVSKS